MFSPEEGDYNPHRVVVRIEWDDVDKVLIWNTQEMVAIVVTSNSSRNKLSNSWLEGSQQESLEWSKELNIPKGLWHGTKAARGSHTSHRELMAWPVGPGCSDLLARSALQNPDRRGLWDLGLPFLCLCREGPAGNVSGSRSCAVWRRAQWPNFLSCLSL